MMYFSCIGYIEEFLAKGYKENLGNYNSAKHYRTKQDQYIIQYPKYRHNVIFKCFLVIGNAKKQNDCVSLYFYSINHLSYMVDFIHTIA